MFFPLASPPLFFILEVSFIAFNIEFSEVMCVKEVWKLRTYFVEIRKKDKNCFEAKFDISIPVL